jgi:hypothetical protein
MSWRSRGLRHPEGVSSYTADRYSDELICRLSDERDHVSRKYPVQHSALIEPVQQSVRTCYNPVLLQVPGA